MTRHERGQPKMFRLPVSRRRLSSEIDRELCFHIEGRIDELVASGYTREAAEREVAERFGDLRSVREECEEIDVMTHRRRKFEEWRAAFGRDVPHAIRGLAQRPAFSAVVGLPLVAAVALLRDAGVGVPQGPAQTCSRLYGRPCLAQRQETAWRCEPARLTRRPA